MNYRIDLTDPHLFGTPAAEDEDDAVFESYQLERMELARLISDSQSDNLVVVSAFRGEGKSALLRIAIKKLRSVGKEFVSRTTATSITPEKNATDVAVLTRLWKAAIYSYLAKQVGSKIGFAWQGDDMSLVEFAQNGGLKSKHWSIALFDRLRIVVPGGGEIGRKTDASDEVATGSVQRWAENNEGFWLFVDDVDANFKDTKESRAKLMAFFQAAREIRNETPRFKLRATIRPNIWAILKSEFPDAGKLASYLVDLKWEERDIRDLIAARIRAYLVRKGFAVRPMTERELIALCFEDPMNWAGSTRPPHVVLSTFSRARPRWAIEICTAAANVVPAGRDRIVLANVTGVMADVGQERRIDLASEYEPQCRQIGQIIDIFHGGDEEYSTQQVSALIQEKMLNHWKPEIVGAGGTGVTSQVVLRLLFEIGFLTAKEHIAGRYQHFSFADNPQLIGVIGPVPERVRWEIHPIFRQALGIRDSSGKRAFRMPRSH